jgi:hypothetical protein
MQLENGVNGIARRRWDTQRAPKGAHLASKPIKLQTPAVFEIVCHRSLMGSRAGAGGARCACACLARFQRHRARRHGIRDGRAGSVTVIQRFGGGLNLNVHYQRAV